MAASYVRHEKLRTLLSFHPLLVGGNPFDTTSIYALIHYLERRWGVHCAIGGTGKLIQGMVSLIEGQGSRVVTNTTVKSVETRNGEACGVRLDDDQVVPAEVVVSNADSAWTYQHLLPDIKRRRWTDRKLGKAKYSMSLFVWYFGTRRRFEDVSHHTILLGKRYRGLLNDIFKNKILADDFSLYLHRPTASDSSLAPAGCDSFYVLSPVPQLDGGVDWADRAESYRQSIARYLSDTIMPGFEDEIVTSRVLTPEGFESRLSSLNGAAFSLAPVFQQSAWFRPHNISEEVSNLYLVGAGTHPGAGVPGVLSSAKVLDSVVPHARVISQTRQSSGETIG